MRGRCCFVTYSMSIAALRLDFCLADFGLTGVDFDAALLKDSEVRSLTRSIARWLYEQKDTPIVLILSTASSSVPVTATTYAHGRSSNVQMTAP